MKEQSNQIVDQLSVKKYHPNQNENQFNQIKDQPDQKMDQFKLEMNWNQEELEQWALAAKQKEDDNLALQRYTRADEVKIKELNLQIEKLTKEVIESKVSSSPRMAEEAAAPPSLVPSPAYTCPCPHARPRRGWRTRPRRRRQGRSSWTVRRRNSAPFTPTDKSWCSNGRTPSKPCAGAT